MQTCEFTDKDFIKCSTGSVQGLFDHLISGIEGVEGLDSIDPMRIDRIRILQGEGPVSVNASLTKVKVTGFSKVKVIENQVSSKDYSWVTTVKLPKMRLEGNYHMMGRILVIPLNVRNCLIELNDTKLNTTTSFRVAANVGLSQVSVLVTLKLVHMLIFLRFSLKANMNIKFYTKTNLYAKNGHTFYNVTGCRGN